MPRSRLSKTPSWITLGFVLGVLFMLSLPHDAPKKPAAPPEPALVRLERPKLTEVEAVFAEWGDRAVWEHDLTEVALWDTEKRSYTIFYEVLRREGQYYFRSIPRLTRPILERGTDPQAPLLVTETEKTRREWIERGRYEPRTEPQETPDGRR
ncbi:hypothetical protein [Opitutus terrae]|uniref:hypothetical protein n=1 Tax=Opitutus terrae TaxID=107709 RepID=UPI0003249D92|nr:hypothetical protein [Opitutus terrae]